MTPALLRHDSAPDRLGRDAATLEARWDALAAAPHAPITADRDWCLAWWNHLGEPAGAHLAVADGPGVVPLAIERVRLGPVRPRVARLAGAVRTPAVLAPAMPADADPEHLADALHRALDGHAVDALALGPLDADAPGGRALLAAADVLVRRGATMVRRAVVAEQAVLDLPDDPAALVAQLPRNLRDDVRRRRRELARTACAGLSRHRTPEAIDAAFDAFAALHAEQWRAAGQGGHFHDWPHATAFHRELLARFAARDRALIVSLDAEGAPRAMLEALLAPRTVHCLLSARADDALTARLGAARLALLDVLEAAIARGCRRADLGTPCDAYKLRLGAEARPVPTLVLALPGRSARTVRAASRLAELLDLAYRRAWRRRLRPRLGLRPAPFARAWLDSRL